MSDWSRDRVLVTGATGFVGGNLAKALLDAGAEVYTFERERRAKSSLKALGIYDQVTLIPGDICDVELVHKVFNEEAITVAYHLAAQAIVGTANASPLSTFRSNIEGTWSVLEGARHCRTLNALVVASSDKAYGVHEQLPYTEDQALMGRYPYDASKACTDILAQSYAITYGLPVSITRNANTYGPADLNFSRLIPDAIRCALEGRPFEIRSDGKMQRDYCYVGDIVEGYMLLAKSLHRDDVRGEAFNFGTGEPRSVLDVTQRIFDIVGGEQKAPVVLNQAKYEIPVQYLDVAKATRVWQWQAKVGLDEGLKKTVDWYREYLSR